MVVFSTGKISSTACTVEFAIASAFRSSDDADVGFPNDDAAGDAGAAAGTAPASATATEKGTGLPATFSAIDDNQAAMTPQRVVNWVHWVLEEFGLLKPQAATA